MSQNYSILPATEKKYLKDAIWDSIPIMFAYIPLSITWGLLWEQAGFSILWAAIYSLFIYAGTVQFLAVPFLLNPVDPISFGLTALAVAMRTGVYTSSLWHFLPKGRTLRLALSFLMVDGTYATLLTKESHVLKEKSYTLTLSLLIYFYWLIGSLIGASVGSYLPNEVTDLQFALPCLISILVIQQINRLGHIWPVLISSLVAISLWLLGVNSWFLPALLLSLALCFPCLKIPPKEESQSSNSPPIQGDTP